MILAIVSLYLNFVSVRVMLKVLYSELGEEAFHEENKAHILQKEEIETIRDDVRKWVKAN